MEPSQAQPEEKKGIKKLWAKLKATMKSQPSFSKSPAAATSSSDIATNTMLPLPTQTPDQLPVPTKNATQIQPVQSTTTERPAGQPADKSISTSDIIEVDDEEAEDQENASIHYHSGTTDQRCVPPLPTSSSGPLLASARDPSAQRIEVAQDIYSRYNFVFDSAEFKAKAKPHVERVERRPRMRVRWTCHECKSTFGRDKNCPKCSHWKCRECIRYPAKTPGDRAKKMSLKTQAAPPVLEKPTTGACHECKTLFEIPAAQCSNCKHLICGRCLQETVQEAPVKTSVATTS